MLAGMTGAVADVAVSADGLTAIAGGTEKTARLWKLPAANAVVAGQPIAATAEYSVPVAITNVSLSGDASRLATSGDDGIVRIFDIASGQELERLVGHAGASHSIDFAADGKTILSGSEDKTGRLWTLAAQRVVVAHQGPASDLALLKITNSFQLVTAGADKLARIWSVTGEPIVDLAGAADAVLSVTSNADGSLIAASVADGKLLAWSPDGKAAFMAEVASPIHSLKFTAADQVLATGCADNRVRLLSAKSGRLLEELGPVGPAPAANAELVPIGSLAVATDGRTILASGNGNAGSILRRSLITVLDAHKNGANSVVFTPDGKQLITGGADLFVRTWTLATESPIEFASTALNLFSGPKAAVTSVDVSGPAAKPVVAAASADGAVYFWEMPTAASDAPMAAAATFTSRFTRKVG